GAAPEGQNTSRRGAQLWPLVAGLVSAALLLWGANQLSWGFVADWRPGQDRLPGDIPGSAAVGGLAAVALLSLAAVAAVLGTRGWVRRGVGVVLALAGIWVLWSAISFDPGAAVGVVGDTGHVPVDPLSVADPGEGGPPWGRMLGGAGGVVLVLSGLSLVLRSGALPVLGGRYRTPADRRSAVPSDRQLWEAMDSGDDPTAARDQHDAARE
ncbi:Trp biosynthesis-associated membrane protein, partial [Actinoalloteichus spitiensis]|uniref:Trp biosynthesis-associated membrane protein n=1 Tax=Actinoalloteichus spitiensis TaxID=252394 RepID=UPI000371D650